MKRRRHMRKNIRRLPVFTACFIVIILLVNIKDISADEVDSIDIKRLIETYFDAHYKCLSDLQEKDIAKFYDLKSVNGEKSYNLDKEVLSYIIASRLIQGVNLKLSQYKFDLTYKSIDINSSEANIMLVENSEFKFSCINDGFSKKHNIEHKFTLRKIENQWKITRHDSSEDEFMLIRDGMREFRSYEGVKDYYLDMMRKEKNKENTKIRNKKSDEEELKREKEDSLESNASDETVKINYYDREKAVLYAKKWTENGEKLRNSPPWSNYDSPLGGGDCTNFVSQCIYAGGIPMDYKGIEYEQWKWYSDTYNPAPVPKGRVASWTGVDPLYNYCKNNKAFGMSAQIGDDWSLLHIGDVVQLGRNEKDFFHSVIVSGYIYDKNEVLKDFLISCHTTDRSEYPLSAYSYPLKRYIHIKGWRR
jgi:hypothetical protein